MIGGDAQVNVTAGSLSAGALFDDIYNYGAGQIGRDAIISLNLSNSFIATGNAEFESSVLAELSLKCFDQRKRR
jgi:hypothetical protein